ncbi:MAG: RNA-binding protein [Mariprofundaceae bacterium]|nr:RNA-binding protein [Mariprofundaceae bacterium]
MHINVGNMFFGTSEEDITEAFSKFGTVASVRLMTNSEGQSRGFGFIEMPDDHQGRTAIRCLNGYEFAGRKLRVNEIDASEMPS